MPFLLTPTFSHLTIFYLSYKLCLDNKLWIFKVSSVFSLCASRLIWIFPHFNIEGQASSNFLKFFKNLLLYLILSPDSTHFSNLYNSSQHKGLCIHFSLINHKMNCVFSCVLLLLGRSVWRKSIYRKKDQSNTFSKNSSPLLLTDQSLSIIIYTMFLCFTD